MKKVTAAEVVVTRVRALIDEGTVQSGDRLPPERDLARQLGVSRPSVRSGLKSLAAMGIVQIRQGAGTFITAGPPVLASEPLSFLAALHGFSRAQMFEARLVLEVAVAGLAAERVTPERLMTISDETTEMFAALDASGGVPRARHPVPSGGRRRVGQPDPRVAGRDGLEDVLRVPAPDDWRRDRQAAGGGGAPRDLPGHPRPGSRSGRARRWPVTCAARR